MIAIDVDEGGSCVVARLSGTLDAESTEEFAASLEQHIPAGGSALLVELSQVASIDSSGLGAIIKLVTHAKLRQGQVLIVAPSPFVMGVLEATHLDTWLDVCPTLEEAVERARNP